MAERRKRSQTLKSQTPRNDVLGALRNVFRFVDKTLSQAIAPSNAEATQNVNNQVNNNLQDIGFLNQSPNVVLGSLINNRLQKTQSDVAQTVLKNFLKKKAEEVIELPGGQEVLASNIGDDDLNVLNSLAPTENVNPNQSFQSSQRIVPERQQGFNVLQRIGRAGLAAQGIDPSQVTGIFPETRRDQLENIIKEQQITGQTPLQIGEREKIELQSAVDLRESLTLKGLEGLSTQESGDFSLLLEGRDSVVQIDNLLEDNVTLQLFGKGQPLEFLKSQKGKLFQSALEQAIQSRTRIETGAALAPGELKATVKRFLPRAGDNIKTARKRLSVLFDFFNRSIQIADPSGIHQRRARESRQTFIKQQNNSGLLQSIREEKRKRGL